MVLHVNCCLFVILKTDSKWHGACRACIKRSISISREMLPRCCQVVNCSYPLMQFVVVYATSAFVSCVHFMPHASDMRVLPWLYFCSQEHHFLMSSCQQYQLRTPAWLCSTYSVIQYLCSALYSNINLSAAFMYISIL